MNKAILLAIKHCDDKCTDSKDELSLGVDVADAAAFAISSVKAGDDRAASYFIDDYFRLSGESKQDYIDALKGNDCEKLR